MLLQSNWPEKPQPLNPTLRIRRTEALRDRVRSRQVVADHDESQTSRDDRDFADARRVRSSNGIVSRRNIRESHGARHTLGHRGERQRNDIRDVIGVQSGRQAHTVGQPIRNKSTTLQDFDDLIFALGDDANPSPTPPYYPPVAHQSSRPVPPYYVHDVHRHAMKPPYYYPRDRDYVRDREVEEIEFIEDDISPHVEKKLINISDTHI